MLSVANSCHYNENFKMANIVYRQIPAPRELPQQIPAPREKAWMQKSQGGGKFLVQIPGDARGMVMDETDTCINRIFILTPSPLDCPTVILHLPLNC